MEFGFLGFTVFDVALLFACSIGAILGSLVQAILATIHHDGPPRSEKELRIAPPHIRKIRAAWLSMRLFIGAVLGFVFALYFVGMLNQSAATFCRIWALSFLVGYAAPKLWVLKGERVAKRMIESGGDVGKV
ncbi:hypothetical protein [Aquipseudomonas alcaligenes]|jgi:hypothetical protein|uniref:Uncharacterized protein n=1 Tax=Aquipseudomonas alcaligenes TaxID=43263 RepID=A0A1N6QVY6_AQUAC|nr:hypothetical protein [Pseudomonas alcaligenes]SIQ20672.1 hypothetical protein SAMN05878282_102694 [Pseudomonas alcaligenes]